MKQVPDYLEHFSIDDARTKTAQPTQNDGLIHREDPQNASSNASRSHVTKTPSEMAKDPYLYKRRSPAELRRCRPSRASTGVAAGGEERCSQVEQVESGMVKNGWGW